MSLQATFKKFSSLEHNHPKVNSASMVRWWESFLYLPNSKAAPRRSYLCKIFEVAQRYWMFVGAIERLCNVIHGIKTFLNILHNLKILCHLWVVLRNIPSVLLFHFSFLCLSIDMRTKCEERAIVTECIELYKSLPAIWNVSALAV